MCFSAKASFITAGTLSVIGLLSIRTAASSKTKKFVPFATSPCIFALQQTCEGIVWLALTHAIPPSLHTFGIYSFIFFAGVWWPIWTSTILYIVEFNKTRQKLLLCTLAVGIATGIIYCISLITQPAQAFPINHHIYYPTLSYPFASQNNSGRLIESCIFYIYFTATVVPFFISSIRLMWIMGMVMGLACLTSQLFAPTSVSIWCFFAALTSGIMYIIVRREKK